MSYNIRKQCTGESAMTQGQAYIKKCTKKLENINQLPTILTIKEIVELLRTTKSTVYRLIKQNQIPAKKVGKEWRIYRDDLIDMIRGYNRTDEENK
jgi:excisionase family DNA binding protein